MSVVTYNNVSLPYCFITNLRQEVVYDDEGGVDWFCTKFDVEVQSVLNSNYLSLIAPSLVGTTTNPVDIMNVIRSSLLKPRRSLSITFNGVQLIPAQTAGSGLVDVRNGPKPQSCIITQLTNTTFLVTYRIVAHYWENNNLTGSSPAVSNQSGNNVLYNRWTETVDIDKQNYTRRTREGKFVIRSDNASGVIADQLRNQMAVVGVPQGFLRESASYTVSPDGLAIQYRIVDKEQFKMPPSPAFEPNGEYIETSTYKGVHRYAECRVALKGDKVTNQSDLIEKAVQVASSKLAIANSDAPGTTDIALLERAVVRVNMYDNEVECVMRAMLKPAGGSSGSEMTGDGRKDGVWGFRYDGMAITPFSEQPIAPPNYLNRGTASLLLQAAAYWDPSLGGTQLDPVGGQNTTGLPPGTAGVTQEGGSQGVGGTPQSSDNPLTPIQPIVEATVTVGQINSDDQNALYANLSSDKSIWTDYLITSRYESDKHIYMMPVSSPNGFQGASVAFCQMANPTLLWIVDWTAAKFVGDPSDKPEIPSTVTVDPQWILLDQHYETAPLALGPDGTTPLYRISGTYVYGHTNPSLDVIDNVTFPRPPWLDDVFDRTLPISTFTAKLFD